MDDAEIKEAVEVGTEAINTHNALTGNKDKLCEALKILVELGNKYLSVKGVEKKDENKRMEWGQAAEVCGWNDAIDATHLWIAKRLPTKKDILDLLNSMQIPASPKDDKEYLEDKWKEVTSFAISELIRERLK